MHTEGPAVREDDGRYLYEYVLSDHLGNARIRFADTDRNGYVDRRTATSDVTEVLQETHYYPFDFCSG